ncbi:hypothetical protein V6N12_030290 [Hibiscus sabdariffa]|uniref:Uncharacterized protein n=1 Tax=Hibiscus sabdariffa TaxID=183260 RepID=A0ABR2C0G7_9ROSI
MKETSDLALLFEPLLHYVTEDGRLKSNGFHEKITSLRICLAKLIEHPLQFSLTLSLCYREISYKFPGVIFRECLGFMSGTWTLGSLRGISKTSLGFSASSAMFG